MPRPEGFRPDIEGLRAVAVLLVMVYHAGLPFLPHGFLGVDVFFVISGYLITSLLLRELASTGTHLMGRGSSAGAPDGCYRRRCSCSWRSPSPRGCSSPAAEAARSAPTSSVPRCTS